MRRLLSLLLFAFACSAAQADEECLVVGDLRSGAVVVREGTICGERIGPASTFKFVLAVIGYDAGLLVDADRPALPYRDAYQATRAADRTTVTPRSWMRDSVLWYSRELVADLGAERFAAYVARLGYGNADVSSERGTTNGSTHSWLNRALQVSPDEQMAFVRGVLTDTLPVSTQALRRAMDIVPVFDAAPGWTVHGKTGTGYIREPDGRLGNRQYGWFIGWATSLDRTLVFAALRKNERPGGNALGPRVRDALIARWSEIARAASP